MLRYHDDPVACAQLAAEWEKQDFSHILDTTARQKFERLKKLYLSRLRRTGLPHLLLASYGSVTVEIANLAHRQPHHQLLVESLTLLWMRSEAACPPPGWSPGDTVECSGEPEVIRLN